MTTVFFDLETGGLKIEQPIIQLAAIAIDDEWRELATFEAKIQFDFRAADPAALELNHYDAAVWRAEAIPAATAVQRFSRFLDPYRCFQRKSKRPPFRKYTVAQLAGHNAATFDGDRLKALYKAHDAFLGADPRILDTFQLGLWHFHGKGEPENYKLGTLCKAFGIEFGDDAHDALYDVRKTAELARVMLATPRGQVAA